jgi:hypothetical protein
MWLNLSKYSIVLYRSHHAGHLVILIVLVSARSHYLPL